MILTKELDNLFRVAVLKTCNSGRRDAFVKQFCKKLQELKKYVKDFDCDSADHWSDYMRGVSVPAEYCEGLERLHMDILAARFSSCAQTIDDLLNEIK